ncbi:VTT domain-containing protein [Brevibacterium casei]|uniref:DedA family protein n=1 Tax=Brevibacterium casei TaxID=33889 RepID=UPI0019187368|nr:VTT domain-containing protein [Brevibacterium casei]QQT68105.1 VTT domain-containing protein [Brevibacterium casei]
MNPLDWSLPIAVTWLILFGIILARAGGTYLLGRLARKGMQRIDRVERIMSGPRYRRAEAMIERFGAPVVAVSFLTVGLQTVVNLAAGTTGMSARRYVPALILGGSLWALIYSTVGLIGFRALAMAYAAAPGLTVGLGVFFVLAIAGLVIGLRRGDGASDETPRDTDETPGGMDAAPGKTGAAPEGTGGTAAGPASARSGDDTP